MHNILDFQIDEGLIQIWSTFLVEFNFGFYAGSWFYNHFIYIYENKIKLNQMRINYIDFQIVVVLLCNFILIR